MENMKDNITVGDEIICNDIIGIVTCISKRLYHILEFDGGTSSLPIDVPYISKNIKKTGRHFDQIEDLLKELRKVDIPDQMVFPDTWGEFEELYGFTDSLEIYTKGSRLIPSFRVEQWLYHLHLENSKS